MNLRVITFSILCLFSGITHANEQAYYELALETANMPKDEKLEEMVHALVEGQIKTNPNIRPIKNAFSTFYKEIFSSNEMASAMASMQMEFFTYEELLELKELMKNSIFVKYEEIMPQIMQKSILLSNQIVMNNQERLKELVKKEQDHIAKLQKLDKELMLTNPE